ncbi:MerR family transcriptional regulator [Inhella sp.]|uniref:MerR family transcriptional regulator n=1 Tax=Inhella sp. TaxID=1921806 RepID=UPI0035AF2932
MRIGELAAAVGIRASAIRFYEASGLLPEGRRGANGYRDYDDAALKRLQMIQLAQRLGFSLETLRGLFAAARPGVLPKEDILRELQRRRDEIAALREHLDAQERELLGLMAACETQWTSGACLDLTRVAPAEAVQRSR